MESPEFEEFGKAMIEYITHYLDNIRDRYVEKPIGVTRDT